MPLETTRIDADTLLADDLLASGWRFVNGDWLSPRSSVVHTEDSAIYAEQLHRVVEETVGRELRALDAIWRLP